MIKRAFPYYGSKTRLAPLYPAPTEDTIIEPFAGAAAYSQLHWQKKVILYDVNPRVINCWNFLILANEQDVLNLPDVHYGLNIESIESLSVGEKALMQFFAYDGFSGIHGRAVGKRCIWNHYKPYVAKMVYRFNHWKAFNASWQTSLDDHATWFIDPPYQFGGEHYEFSNKNLDYSELSEFCCARQGQVIVCENTKASWLPFNPLAKLTGIKHTTTECIWTRGTDTFLKVLT